MLKFQDPIKTLDGKKRATVRLQKLETLWFNTGTQCNLSCQNCYIESNPRNDRLSYIQEDEVNSILSELEGNTDKPKLIAFTGGEPFLNPHIMGILNKTLSFSYDTLVLSNAYKVLKRHKDSLKKINALYPKKLFLRISLDHHSKEVHEKERGPLTFDETLKEIQWLHQNNFQISIAGRSLTKESIEDALASYQKLLQKHSIDIPLILGENIVIFPEMSEKEDTPEITTDCWNILQKKPSSLMCAKERMVVKRKDHEKTTILPCTLIAYDERFDLGTTLSNSQKEIPLNHPFCSQFCVLGDASCSGTK